MLNDRLKAADVMVLATKELSRTLATSDKTQQDLVAVPCIGNMDAFLNARYEYMQLMTGLDQFNAGSIELVKALGIDSDA